MEEDNKKTDEHIEYHIVHDEDEELQHKQDEPNLTVYALIKYASLIIIVVAVLYFIAVFILPLVRDFLRG